MRLDFDIKIMKWLELTVLLRAVLPRRGCSPPQKFRRQKYERGDQEKNQHKFTPPGILKILRVSPPWREVVWASFIKSQSLIEKVMNICLKRPLGLKYKALKIIISISPLIHRFVANDKSHSSIVVWANKERHPNLNKGF
jgi:hypothetical protein